MRIDSPQVVGSLTLAEGSTASLSGSFSGSFEGHAVFNSIEATDALFVNAIFESSSTIVTSGSNVFGNDANDIQQITGSLTQSGSMDIVGQISASGVGLFSGLGVGTAASGTIGAIRATNDIVAFASSDERLKENVTLIGNALDKVESLRGVEFDWISNEEIHPNHGHDLGVIAQEVEAVLPVLVQTRENGYKAVKYDKLTAVLIEAVKELSARVKELESK